MINIEKKEKADVVSFSINKINALNTEVIQNTINKLFDLPNSRVIINLTGIEYIDSTGFGCFLSILKAARNNYGILKFASPEPNVNQLFHTLHLHTVFQIYDDMNACIESFG